MRRAKTGKEKTLIKKVKHCNRDRSRDRARVEIITMMES